jgi:hypothetical protein
MPILGPDGRIASGRVVRLSMIFDLPPAIPDASVEAFLVNNVTMSLVAHDFLVSKGVEVGRVNVPGNGVPHDA